MSVWPGKLPKSATKPFVSILTPTYNRRKFIPFLIACIKDQTYPKERIEWVVFDDGSDSIEDLLRPEFQTIIFSIFGLRRNRLSVRSAIAYTKRPVVKSSSVWTTTITIRLNE